MKKAKRFLPHIIQKGIRNYYTNISINNDECSKKYWETVEPLWITELIRIPRQTGLRKISDAQKFMYTLKRCIFTTKEFIVKQRAILTWILLKLLCLNLRTIQTELLTELESILFKGASFAERNQEFLNPNSRKEMVVSWIFKSKSYDFIFGRYWSLSTNMEF